LSRSVVALLAVCKRLRIEEGRENEIFEEQLKRNAMFLLRLQSEWAAEVQRVRR
jgi:hypothetical protein